jgi:hypothetical protein
VFSALISLRICNSLPISPSTAIPVYHFVAHLSNHIHRFLPSMFDSWRLLRCVSAFHSPPCLISVYNSVAYLDFLQFRLCPFPCCPAISLRVCTILIQLLWCCHAKLFKSVAHLSYVHCERQVALWVPASLLHICAALFNGMISLFNFVAYLSFICFMRWNLCLQSSNVSLRSL